MRPVQSKTNSGHAPEKGIRRKHSDGVFENKKIANFLSESEEFETYIMREVNTTTAA